jgi:hypothetical protein
MQIDDSYLRTRFKDYCILAGESSAKPKPLKRILMVGAIMIGRALEQTDQIWLGAALLAAEKKGIIVDPDFEVEVVNLDHGEDFLDGDYQADLVISCWVPRPQKGHFNEGGLPVLRGYFGVSPKAREKSIWHQALVRSGAQVVAVMGDISPEDRCTEVLATDFMGPGFVNVPYSDGCSLVVAETLAKRLGLAPMDTAEPSLEIR